MNNRTLLIIFIVLAAIYGITQLVGVKKERSFKTELIKVDTSEVNMVKITRKNNGGEITLKREATGWIVSDGTLNVKATQSSVSSILGILDLVKTKRIAAKSSDKWSDYEVGDTSGTKVQVYLNDDLKEDFIVGRLSFKQPPQQGFNQQQPQFNPQSFTSFVRFTGQEEVYAVDGYLSMTINQDFDTYRDKQLIKVPAEAEITQITITPQGASPLDLNLQNGQWMLNNEQALDSTKVANYVNTLKNISAYEFADDFDEIKTKDLVHKTLMLKGNNLLDPITVYAYRDSTREQPFVLRSNQNTAFFSSDSSGVYQRVFKPVEELMASTE